MIRLTLFSLLIGATLAGIDPYRIMSAGLKVEEPIEVPITTSLKEQSLARMEELILGTTPSLKAWCQKENILKGEQTGFPVTSVQLFILFKSIII